MEELFYYIEQYERLTKVEKQLITKNCQLIHLKKGTYFLEEGKYCHKIGFVQEGILRIYNYDLDGKDVTQYFVSKKQFATNLRSYKEKVVSDTFIKAEMDSQLVVMTREKMNTLSNQLPRWDKIISRILESKLLEKVKHKTEMINQDATKRYLAFLETHKNVANHVKLTYIASYLGITQYSLSRIRKNLHHHDFLPNGKS